MSISGEISVAIQYNSSSNDFETDEIGISRKISLNCKLDELKNKLDLIFVKWINKYSTADDTNITISFNITRSFDDKEGKIGVTNSYTKIPYKEETIQSIINDICQQLTKQY
jgi:hypothetical protein